MRRGLSEVVRNVSLQVRAGECVGLLGLNGSGKTTLLASIAGTLPVAAGAIRMDEHDLTARPSWVRSQHGLVLVPAGRQLFGEMTVHENLLVGAHKERSGRRRGELIESVHTYFPVLHDKRRQRARELSGGQQQMLAIARGLMAQPRVLLLDEPSEGLAPVIVDQVFDAIETLTTKGSLAILLAEQNAGAAAICSSSLILRDGSLSPVGGSGSDDISSEDVAGVVFG